MKSFSKYLSLLLLAAFAFIISPGELLHELSHHEDTKDVLCTDACRDHISNEHQHCEVLQLAAPPFHLPIKSFSFDCLAITCTLKTVSTSSYYSSSSSFLFLRGPPSNVG